MKHDTGSYGGSERMKPGVLALIYDIASHSSMYHKLVTL